MSVAAPRPATTGLAFLSAFGVVALGVGAARAVTTTYVPVLLDRIEHAPGLIGAVMLVNAAAGFAVPLLVGLWSDRWRNERLGRRVPFMVGGTVVTAGGLVAIALGTASSYAVLAFAAAAVYVGLNATATAHRALVAEAFEDHRRPAATSAQEIAMLVGGLAGLVMGGVLVDTSAWLLFVAVAVAVPLLGAPTLAVTLRHLRGPSATAVATNTESAPRARDFAQVMRQPGAREVLVAQTLWVAGYAALPAFFILYARDVLAVGAGAASAVLAGFGILTGGAMLAAGRAAPRRVYPLLMLGAALLGTGLVTASAAGSLAMAAGPFAAAAIGAGLVTALGFPYFARFIPRGQAGRYSGLYFSVRAIGSATALPIAGLAIELSGSYRSLLVLGAAALFALIPLGMAEARRRPAVAVPRRVAPRRIAAIIPCDLSDRLEGVVSETLRHVHEVVVVDDGASPRHAPPIDRVATWEGVRLVRLEANSGKGEAVAAGAAALLSDAERPDAIMVLDADAQHPPGRIPAFIEAASTADVVIGDRRADRAAMPRVRRLTNSISSALLSLTARRRLPDSQCGMRLYRTEVLEAIPLPPGRYEAETRHLKAVARAGLGIGWVPIPAIYAGAPSSFRPVADTARVLGAIVAGPPREAKITRGPHSSFLRRSAVRLGLLVACTWALAALVPLVGPLDERVFLAVNGLGAGPDWLYQALDPHTRNYILISVLAVAAASLVSRRAVIGTAAAVLIAAFFSDLLVQLVYLLYDRPRPEEVLGSQALLVEGRSWAHIASFPSGHLVVTTAIAVAGMSGVPSLRGALWLYVGAIALTRVTFGAHFPLDVVVGLAFGYEIGRFSAAWAHTMGLLPHRPADPLPVPGWRHGPVPGLARLGATGAQRQP